MNNNNYDYNNFTSYYPYGELPLKYTKQGQQQIKNKLENNSSSAFFNFDDKNIENKKIETQSENNKAENNQTEKTIDFKSILPMLSTMGGNEKFNQILTLLNKTDNLSINDLIKLFVSNKPKPANSSNKNSIETQNYIDGLKKVE